MNLYLLYVFAMILLAYLLGALYGGATVTAPPGPVTWLILVYRLPDHPAEAVIRRKATALGAVYPAKSVAALPACSAAGAGLPPAAEHDRRRRRLGRGVARGGG